MKAKLIAYLKHEPFRKVIYIGILIAVAVLFWGWMNFFAEVKAFKQYEQEHLKNANCFPTWKRQEEGA